MKEAETRAALIDPQLARAGWNLADHNQVRLEVPITAYDPTPWHGFTDFSLYDEAGYVAAVVEAKRTARNPREGEEQLRQYVAEIAGSQPYPPFGYMTNGLQQYFWEVDEAHPRPVAGFFSPSDLARLRFLREQRQPLSGIAINDAIVDRPYQHEAIRRVAEAFTEGRRRALLVMATGTGKTRTTMGLIDICMRGFWAQKILFLADRDALVEQALSDGFKRHLPNEPRVRIHTARIDREQRLFVATLQTMGRSYEHFSPGFFDLIVFDEAHRSIFNRFNEVVEYFDARMVGLTATPADFVERDTFRVFGCRDRTPTFLYTYRQAVDEKRLVDFRLYKAQTGFQRKGIKGADLSQEDQDALMEQGIDPDSLDYAGTDIEVEVSNRDTLRRQWDEIMDVCIKDRGGALPGKTIVFAMTKAHADRIRDVFEEMFPQHLGLVQVIHHGMERVHDGPYGDGLISKFRKASRPRIAVSVDMLDTGIDIPEVVNLVFMKPVQSRIKLWQMVGRGTRNQEACTYFDRLPDGVKTEFLVIDFWENDFERQYDTRVPTDTPLLVRLFNTRLDILAATLGDRSGPAHTQAVRDCRAMLARVPTDSFLVRKVWADVETAWSESFWLLLAARKLDFLRLKVGPLLRFVSDVDVAAETFTHKVERLKSQLLAGRASAALLGSIAEDVSLLPAQTLKDPRYAAAVALALSTDLTSASPTELDALVSDLAPEMRHKRRLVNTFLHIDLPDFIADKGYVVVGPSAQRVHVDEYRRRIERRILAVAERHPALAAMRNGDEPSEEQLVDLERVLNVELSGSGLYLTDQSVRQAYGLKLDSRRGFLGFARHVLDLDAIPDYEAVVSGAFVAHIASRNYTGDQIRFLRSVQEVFLERGRLSEADLYDPPLTVFGRNAVERFFGRSEIEEIVELTDRLAA